MALPVEFAAGASTASFQFLGGTGPLCRLATNACPDITMADNGDIVAVNGQGTLSFFTNSATGGGTFEHMAPDGTVRTIGTWTTIRLISLRSLGNYRVLPS